MQTIDAFPKVLGEFKKLYHDKYYIPKKEEADHNDLLKKQIPVIHFDDLMENIKLKFGGDSEEYLMIRTYNEVLPRNDLDSVTFNTKDPNHIDLDNGTINIESFHKTQGKYDGIKDFKLSKGYQDILAESLENNPRNTLFTKKVSSMFTIINKHKVDDSDENIGINLIRHSKISAELEGDNVLDIDKRRPLQKKTFHSLKTQLQYIRPLKSRRNLE